jgi:hypothetical protein
MNFNLQNKSSPHCSLNRSIKGQVKKVKAAAVEIIRYLLSEMESAPLLKGTSKYSLFKKLLKN